MYIICKMIYLLTNYLISVMFHTFLLKVRSDRTSNHLGYNLAMLSYKKRHDFFSLFALLYLFNIKNIWGLEKSYEHELVSAQFYYLFTESYQPAVQLGPIIDANNWEHIWMPSNFACHVPTESNSLTTTYLKGEIIQ